MIKWGHPNFRKLPYDLLSDCCKERPDLKIWWLEQGWRPKTEHQSWCDASCAQVGCGEAVGHWRIFSIECSIFQDDLCHVMRNWDWADSYGTWWVCFGVQLTLRFTYGQWWQLLTICDHVSKTSLSSAPTIPFLAVDNKHTNDQRNKKTLFRFIEETGIQPARPNIAMMQLDNTIEGCGV